MFAEAEDDREFSSSSVFTSVSLLDFRLPTYSSSERDCAYRSFICNQEESCWCGDKVWGKGGCCIIFQFNLILMLSLNLWPVTFTSGFFLYSLKKKNPQGRPTGVAVVCTLRFSSQRFIVWDPGCGPTHCLSSHAVAGILHPKYRKMGTAVSSGLIFLKNPPQNSPHSR